MRLFLFFLSLVLPATVVFADPKEDAKIKDDASKSAADLFKTATPAAAVAHLQLTRPAEAIADGRLASTLQGLLEASYSLYNQRDLKHAQDAVWQALGVADPVLSGRTAMPAQRRAQLCNSLGLACETILRDRKMAGDLYRLAVQVNPADKAAVKRRDALAAEDKQRDGRK